MGSFIINCIEYGSFLVIPWIIGMAFQYRNLQKHKIWAGIAIILTILFIYARFIEPERIVVKHEPSPSGLEEFRFALISDLHLGAFKNEQFLTRALAKDDWSDSVDFVIIAGDWVYGTNEKQIEKNFLPLKSLDIPIYAVMGNHDFEPAGELDELEQTKIRTALESNGVTLIDNRMERFKKNNQELQIAGLGELWNNEANIETLEALDARLPSIVVIHNPDVAAELPKKIANLVVAGHTHGGQVRIPWIYRKIIPTELDFGDGQGWYNLNENPLYITSGLGESGLPLRLGVPPEVVIFEPKTETP